ncbi:MAG: electron transport complex subunit RsxC [Omnitrophica bacterium]|nr:electron transport complex subunit RsxC [Candidatus Omnitrophota bacterium]
MAKTFQGGVHLADHKEQTASQPIKKAPDPQRVIIPLSQHVGSPASANVLVGDSVKIGQKIGQAQGFISCPIHSSIAGKVVSIQSSPHPAGASSLAIIIENDGTNALDEGIKPKGDLSILSADEIKAIVKEAGIVGMGGAAFPTHIKLSPPLKNKIDAFILNCAECEPYLTCDYRLLLERTDEVIYGMRALMKALGVKKGCIGIEDNKPEAIKLLKALPEKDKDIEVVVLKTKYPQGAEKQLIKAILNREVPLGKLPLHIGVVVNNVGTAYATACALKQGLPLIKRIVTVAGSGVAHPQNLEVKLGTTFAEVIQECGGSNEGVEKVIMGGPMMGIAQATLDVPVIKGTSGILLLNKDELALEEANPCIKCGRCVDNCPMGHLPLYLGTYGEREIWEKCAELGALDCVECGSCTYLCPAGRPLVQIIKLAKQKIIAEQKKKKK